MQLMVWIVILFVSKYELYLPDRRELQKLLDHIMEQDMKEKEE